MVAPSNVVSGRGISSANSYIVLTWRREYISEKKKRDISLINKTQDKLLVLEQFHNHKTANVIKTKKSCENNFQEHAHCSSTHRMTYFVYF